MACGWKAEKSHQEDQSNCLHQLRGRKEKRLGLEGSTNRVRDDITHPTDGIKKTPGERNRKKQNARNLTKNQNTGDGWNRGRDGSGEERDLENKGGNGK